MTSRNANSMLLEAPTPTPLTMQQVSKAEQPVSYDMSSRNNYANSMLLEAPTPTTLTMQPVSIAEQPVPLIVPKPSRLEAKLKNDVTKESKKKTTGEYTENCGDENRDEDRDEDEIWEYSHFDRENLIKGNEQERENGNSTKYDTQSYGEFSPSRKIKRIERRVDSLKNELIRSKWTEKYRKNSNCEENEEKPIIEIYEIEEGRAQNCSLKNHNGVMRCYWSILSCLHDVGHLISSLPCCVWRRSKRQEPREMIIEGPYHVTEIARDNRYEPMNQTLPGN